MAVGTTTTGANFIPELWSDAVYKFFERKFVMRNTVDDYSGLVKGAGDTIHIPKIALSSANAVTEGAVVTFTGATAGKVDLPVQTWISVAEQFSDLLMIQSQPELISKYTRMFGESLARKLETDLWGELDGFQTTQNLASDNTMANADLESILSTLYANDINPADCFMVVNSSILADLMNPASGMLQYFIRADAVGGNGVELKTGAVGSIYGMQVFSSNAISTSGTTGTVVGAVYHPSSCAIAIQSDVRVQADYNLEKLSTQVVADLVYGVKIIDESGDIRGLNILNP